jgi:uncharacterized protein (TIGR03083 family)
VIYRDGMAILSYDRYCTEIVTQTRLLSTCLQEKDTDLAAPVPSCPGWDVGQLVRHLGGAQRWAEQVVLTRASAPLSDAHYREPAPDPGESPAVLGGWLDEGAARLADALRDAGPDTPLWTPVPGENSQFYARRFTHETAMHRADATLALGAKYTLDPQVALDTIDEWMELGSLPMHFEIHPWIRELLGPGRTLHFHATDTAPETQAEWFIDLTGDVIVWRRAHEKAAVAVRGSLTDLALVIYKRLPARSESLEVLGDAELLDFWLERVSFG